MKHYDSIPRIQDSGELKGEIVWGFNKLDGQNFCVAYNPRKNTFGPFGSRTRTVDENDLQFGDAVKWFKSSDYQEILSRIVKENSSKRGVFNGIQEITFIFEWYGPDSFAGSGEKTNLALIDVFLKKRGYLEPSIYYALFKDSGIELPRLIYTGALDSDIIEKIQRNDWTKADCEFPDVKEGVVFKRSTMLKGQRRPSVKVKTKWWLEKLHTLYTEEECRLLE